MKPKIFISYRFSGENKEKLKNTMRQIHNAIEKSGCSCYSTIFDSDQFANENWSGKKIMQKSFGEIDSSDVVLFLVQNKKISPGMLVELGYVLAKGKKLLLAINKKVTDSIFRRQIAEIIEFKSLTDLKGKLSELKCDYTKLP
ncbi:MAG: nucleoside 2-deoxyribosyltransferase [DPANN group archaeon]|nr:nucleoside 2-deoxyribosyltransferase [DPANN group archaeon]